MRYQMVQKPDFAAVRIHFDQPGEQIVAESAAMLGRDTAVDMKTQLQGGLFAAAKRKLLGGESLFTNTFTSTQSGQTLWLAPAAEGDLDVVEMNGQFPVFLNSGAFLAAPPSVQIDTKWQGAKGFFSGSGLFLLHATGLGPLFFSAYGGVHAVDVGPYGYVCDTGHVVGFTGGLEYRVSKLGGLKSLFFSGEGLVCTFTGQGRLWISTRNAASLASFIQPFRSVKKSH
jgi:uncharacterized protein (TIGR00266 family)